MRAAERDNIVVTDVDGYMTFIGSAVADLGRWGEPGAVGQHLWDMYAYPVRVYVKDLFDDAVAAEADSSIDQWHEDIQRLVRVTIKPAGDEVLLAFEDVTAEITPAPTIGAADAGEKETSDQRRQFLALVEASPDLITLTDSAGAVVYMNPRGRRMLGIALDADISAYPMNSMREGPSRHDVIPALLRDGNWTGLSYLRHQVSGELIPVEASAFRVNDPDTGRIIAYASVNRDITERLQAEQELARAAAHRSQLLDRLVEAQEVERAQIAADVHDDSVQALAAVDLRLGILRRKIAEVAPQLAEQVTQVQDAVSHATQRLRQLLFDLEPPAEGVSLVDNLRDVTSYMCGDFGVRWSCEGEHDIPLQHGELAQAMRIAREALSNALRHAQAGSIRIRVLRRDEGVEVEISDDGIGVDPETVTSPHGHRGLISMRDRADIAGGWFRLERNEPAGTTARFFLPTSTG